MIINRRKFLINLTGLITAPAIVKASNLMPIKFVENYKLNNTFTVIGDSITYSFAPAGLKRGITMRNNTIFLNEIWNNLNGETKFGSQDSTFPMEKQLRTRLG